MTEPHAQRTTQHPLPRLQSAAVGMIALVLTVAAIPAYAQTPAVPAEQGAQPGEPAEMPAPSNRTGFRYEQDKSPLQEYESPSYSEDLVALELENVKRKYVRLEERVESLEKSNEVMRKILNDLLKQANTPAN